MVCAHGEVVLIHGDGIKGETMVHEEEFVRHFSVIVEEFLSSSDVAGSLHEKSIMLGTVIEFEEAFRVMIDEIGQRYQDRYVLVVEVDSETARVGKDAQSIGFTVGSYLRKSS